MTTMARSDLGRAQAARTLLCYDYDGVWIMTRDGAYIGTVREIFVEAHSVTARHVLWLARALDATVVAVLADESVERGWLVLYDRLPADAAARNGPGAYAEVSSWVPLAVGRRWIRNQS